MQTKKSISLVLHNVDSAFDLKCITAQLFMFFGFNNSLAFSRGSHMLTYRKDLWREHSTDKWTEVDRPNQLYSTSVGWSIHPKKKNESPLVMSMVSFLPYRVLPFSLAFSHGFYPWVYPKYGEKPPIPKAPQGSAPGSQSRPVLHLPGTSCGPSCWCSRHPPRPAKTDFVCFRQWSLMLQRLQTSGFKIF